MLGFIAPAAPRRGAPCPFPALAPSPAHSPVWKQSREAFALWLRWDITIFFFFFVLPLAESKAGERGGGISILGLENPDLQSPAPPFSAPSRNGWRSFPNSQLPGRGKLPARPPGGGEGAGSAPRLPAGPKLSRRGAGLISRPLPRERLPLRQLGRGVRGK